MTTDMRFQAYSWREYPIISEQNPEIDPDHWGALEILRAWHPESNPRDYQRITKSLNPILLELQPDSFEIRSFSPAAKPQNRLQLARFERRGLWSQISDLEAPKDSRVELRDLPNSTKQFVGIFRTNSNSILETLSLAKHEQSIGSVQPPYRQESRPPAENFELIFGPPIVEVNYHTLLHNSIRHRTPGEILIIRFGSFDDPDYGFTLLSDKKIIEKISKKLDDIDTSEC